MRGFHASCIRLGRRGGGLLAPLHFTRFSPIQSPHGTCELVRSWAEGSFAGAAQRGGRACGPGGSPDADRVTRRGLSPVRGGGLPVWRAVCEPRTARRRAHGQGPEPAPRSSRCFPGGVGPTHGEFVRSLSWRDGIYASRRRARSAPAGWPGGRGASCKRKGRGLTPQRGPFRLQVRCPVGAPAGGNWPMPLSLSPASLPLSNISQSTNQI